MSTVEEQAAAKQRPKVGDHIPPPLNAKGDPAPEVVEADLRGGATSPREYYHVDTAIGRVYLRTFTASEAEVCDEYAGTEATAALMALAITDKSRNPKYVVDDPDHAEHGWRHLIDLDHGVFATIAKAIRKRAGALSIDEAVKN